MSSKKGESLVEVLVAITVFMLVFVGVASMITASVTLNLSSRERTKTVAKTQKYLNEFIASISSTDSCNVVALDPDMDPLMLEEDEVGCVENALEDLESHCYWITVETLNADEEDSIGAADAANFIKIVAHGKWNTRHIGEQEFILNKMIRKAE